MSFDNRVRASLTTSFECGNATLCVLAPQSGVRSSIGLFLTLLIPILLGSVQSLHMRWAHAGFSTKFLDVTLRIFFPEGILWLVLQEERERAYVLKELEHKLKRVALSQPAPPVTNRQLMAVQAGKLYLQLVDLNSDHNAAELNSQQDIIDDREHRLAPLLPENSSNNPPVPTYRSIRANDPPYPVSSPPSLRSPSPVHESSQRYFPLPRPSPPTRNCSTSGISQERCNACPRVIWSSRKPTGMHGLDLSDLSEVTSVLSLLPNGGTGSIAGALSLPDLMFCILLFQDAWLLSVIVTRLTSPRQQYKICLLEIFAVFSMTTFLLERLITKNDRPAWTGQYAVVQMNRASYKPPLPISQRHKFQSKSSLLLPSTIAPAIFVILWSVSLFIYASAGKPSYHTQLACQVSALAYILAILYYLLLKAIDRQGREPVGTWTKWLPPKSFVYVVAVLSRIVVILFAIVQVFWGEREIFDGPVVWGMIPHIGG